MSNSKHSQRLNPGSGQMARPKQTWRGIRLPRSARKRWEMFQAIDKLRGRAKGPEVKGLAQAVADVNEPKPSEAIKKWAEANGITLTSWQAKIIDSLPTDKEDIPVG